MYFPEDGLVCGVAEMTTGQLVGIGTMGAEGFIGIGTVRGVPQFAYWSRVLVETTGYRIPATLFRRAFNNSKALRQSTLAYVGRLLLEYARLAACHRIHSQRQRLARWLLTATDRAGQPALPVTHDVLAQMVGGPRHSITTALRELRANGAIDHARASVKVLDREILIARLCECYLKGTEGAAAQEGER